MRLDKYLTQIHPELSRARIQKIIKLGKVFVNGASVRPSFDVSDGDDIRILPLADDTEFVLEHEPSNISVLYEDDLFFVVEKPAGVAVHPSETGGLTGTLVHAFLNKISIGDFDDPYRPGVVHRLDKDTSGLVILVKNRVAYDYFVSLFKARKIEKRYLALVRGNLRHNSGVIDSPIGRDFRDRKRMAVVADGEGRPAISEYIVMEEFSGLSMLDICIKTGRTHQIRVHMSAIGHPVCGDEVYGDSKLNERLLDEHGLSRQFLHAYRLSFLNPTTKEEVTFTSDLPYDLQSVANSLK